MRKGLPDRADRFYGSRKSPADSCVSNTARRIRQTRGINLSGPFNGELGRSAQVLGGRSSLRRAIQIGVEDRAYYRVHDWRRHSAWTEQSGERVALIFFHNF